MKHTRTWIVVADGARSRILERLDKRPDLQLVPGSDKRSSAPSDHDLRRDRPGIVHESVGHTRHAVQPRVDYHQEAEDRFAEDLVARLEGALARDAFDRVVIVAPPVMLGTVRKIMSKRLQERVVAEYDKDLTKTPSNEILKHIEI